MLMIGTQGDATKEDATRCSGMRQRVEARASWRVHYNSTSVIMLRAFNVEL